MVVTCAKNGIQQTCQISHLMDTLRKKERATQREKEENCRKRVARSSLNSLNSTTVTRDRQRWRGLVKGPILKTERQN